MALDLNSLWDHGKPALSESRFREALIGATPDDALILETQIARTFGIRADFGRARSVLASIEPRLGAAAPEAQVRYFLELGRTYASATHPAAARTPENRETAGTHFMRAFHLAEAAGLDDLAIDALHMMVFVHTLPAQQLEWNEKAITYMEQSSQPQAKRWEASLRNNVGYARYLAGEYEEALRQFQQSLAAHERSGRARHVRIAHWMIASTYRAQGRFEEAIAIQLRLEREWDEANEADPYVFDELAHLYQAIGNQERADHYRARHQVSSASPPG